MEKQIATVSINTRQPACATTMFLSFCRALDKYCDEIGVSARNFGAARVLYNAAGNTILQIHQVTPADRRHFKQMEKKIPEMLLALIQMPTPNGYRATMEKMAEMSLAQVAAIIKKNTRSHHN